MRYARRDEQVGPRRQLLLVLILQAHDECSGNDDTPFAGTMLLMKVLRSAGELGEEPMSLLIGVAPEDGLFHALPAENLGPLRVPRKLERSAWRRSPSRALTTGRENQKETQAGNCRVDDGSTNLHQGSFGA